MTHPGLPPLGATVEDTATTFTVWAPKPQHVELILYDGDGLERAVVMEHDGEYAVARVEGVSHGQRYAYRLDGEGPFPDPCSRAQPSGVHGPSEVVDSRRFSWGDAAFAGSPYEDAVIYELHVGTFTPGGTFDSAVERSPALVDLGVTAVEVMPIASFPGDRNWGYDGVALFAPAHSYGGPEAFRRFVDAAHRNGLAVILDVVYNHFGPDGNYTGLYSSAYLTDRHETPWGGAVNYDGAGSEHVRHFVVENVLHWLREYHVDGFRLDAVHEIHDDSAEHILAELRRRTCGMAPGGRDPYLIAETGENDPRYLRAVEQGGLGMDGVWADDFHHTVHVALTGERDGYYSAFTGAAAEVARTVEQGFLYEGRAEPASGEPRGAPARDVPFGGFVYCLQNHDQVGNRAFGERLSTRVSRADYLAASLALLLLPQTPLLFQGQEWGATTPFLYFTDHNPELGALVTRGRREEFRRFPAFNDPALRDRIPDPQSPSTFERSVLDWEDAAAGLGSLCRDFYREALRIRREDEVLRELRARRGGLTATGEDRVVRVEMSGANGRRAILVNLGDATVHEALSPGQWVIALDSADPRWGSLGPRPHVEGPAITLPPHTSAFVTNS